MELHKFVFNGTTSTDSKGNDLFIAKSEVERLLNERAAAIRALEPASGEYVLGWRDISTAPKDGTKVDVWSEKHGRQADARYNPDEYTFGVPWGWSSPWMGRITDATHWKPLDAPMLTAATSQG
jgi:hypothetical protein